MPHCDENIPEVVVCSSVIETVPTVETEENIIRVMLAIGSTETRGSEYQESQTSNPDKCVGGIEEHGEYYYYSLWNSRLITHLATDADLEIARESPKRHGSALHESKRTKADRSVGCNLGDGEY